MVAHRDNRRRQLIPVVGPPATAGRDDEPTGRRVGRRRDDAGSTFRYDAVALRREGDVNAAVLAGAPVPGGLCCGPVGSVL